MTDTTIGADNAAREANRDDSRLTGNFLSGPATLSTMRTIAYNVYGCTGWPDEIAEETWGSEGEVVDRTATALAATDWDLLTIAEAPPAGVVRDLSTELGTDARVFPSRGDWPGAVITDLPILEADAAPELLDEPPADLFTRHAGRAVVTTEGDDFVVYSVHLHPSDEATRIAEIEHLREAIQVDLGADRPVVLQGDLNHRPDGPEYDVWRDIGLTDAYVAAGTEPERTFRADEPAERIDYVWVSERLVEHVEAVGVVVDPPFGPGTAFTRPDGPFLSDHLPVAVEFDGRF